LGICFSSLITSFSDLKNTVNHIDLNAEIFFFKTDIHIEMSRENLLKKMSGQDLPDECLDPATNP